MILISIVLNCGLLEDGFLASDLALNTPQGPNTTFFILGSTSFDHGETGHADVASNNQLEEGETRQESIA